MQVAWSNYGPLLDASYVVGVRSPAATGDPTTVSAETALSFPHPVQAAGQAKRMCAHSRYQRKAHMDSRPGAPSGTIRRPPPGRSAAADSPQPGCSPATHQDAS